MPIALGSSAADWDVRPTADRVGSASALVVALAGAAAALLPGAATSAGPVLLVAAGIIGLPHGAVDHLALGWVQGRAAARPAVLVAYAAAAVLAAGAALAAPRPALLVLLALSVAHFAEGEAAFDRLRGGAGRTLPALALASAVVVLPVELRPEAARSLLVALDPGLPALLGTARVPLLAVTALLVVAGLVSAVRAGQRRPAAELALVVAAALVAPALVVFAAWFACWHSPRHLARLAALEPTGDGRQRMRRLARGSALPTAAAGSGLVLLTVALGGLPGAVLIVLLALTVPHAVVVARLDHLQTRHREPR